MLIDYFEGDISPLPADSLEKLCFPEPYVINTKEEHSGKRGRPLCLYPEDPTESGLSGSVNCVTCRNLWHAKISGWRSLLYDLKIPYRKTPLEVHVDYFCCKRECCVGCSRFIDDWIKYVF